MNPPTLRTFNYDRDTLLADPVGGCPLHWLPDLVCCVARRAVRDTVDPWKALRQDQDGDMVVALGTIQCGTSSAVAYPGSEKLGGYTYARAFRACCISHSSVVTTVGDHGNRSNPLG